MTDDNLPCEVQKDGTSSYTVDTTHGDRMHQEFVTTDSVMALMLLGDA